MKTLRIVIAVLVVLAIAALSGIGRPEPAESAGEEAREGITVTGVGRVSTVPDEAEFSPGITTKGRSAGAALAANSERMRELIEALKAAGIADRDIQTRDVSVGSDYDGTGRSNDFVASNTVSVATSTGRAQFSTPPPGQERTTFTGRRSPARTGRGSRRKRSRTLSRTRANALRRSPRQPASSWAP